MGVPLKPIADEIKQAIQPFVNEHSKDPNFKMVASDKTLALEVADDEDKSLFAVDAEHLYFIRNYDKDEAGTDTVIVIESIPIREIKSMRMNEIASFPFN